MNRTFSNAIDNVG